MSEARLIGLDIGNGFTKFVSSSDRGHFPSVIAMEEPGLDFEGLASARDFVIELVDTGERYAIGWSAPRLGNISVRTLDRARLKSPEYRVLFAAALVAATGQGGTVAPVLGLPLDWYDRREEVRDYLAGVWRVVCDGRQYNFTVPREHIRLVPEGFGALCSMALDLSGRAVNNGLLRMTVGVVDCGTKTTDLSMFDSLSYVPARTRGYPVGLERVYDIMQRLGSRELGHTYTIEELDGVLTGEPLYHGADDVTDHAHDWKHQAMQQVANAIAGHVNTLWQGGQSVQSLLLTGGGAQHLYGYLLDHFPQHLQPVENGPMANAIGHFSYGMMRKARP